MAQMRLVGSKFTKILAERNTSFNGKLSMKTNINIRSVEKVKEAKDTVEIPYVFGIDYADLGKIKIEGIIYLSGDAKAIKEIIKKSKEKDMDSKEYVALTNIVLQKASVKAFELEDELGLPFLIRLPSISPTEE